MEQYTTKELQTEILKLLKEFHKICEENNIRYTLHGGSLLGAVREKGFIPWDDDGDVAMLRGEYERLTKVISHNNNDRVYLDCDRDKVKKIWLKQEGKPTVWLDIFIYDYISQNRISQTIKFITLNFLAAYTKNDVSMEQFRTNQRAKGLKKFVYETIYQCSKNKPINERIGEFDNFCKNRFVGNKRLVHRANDQLWAMPMLLEACKMEEYMLTDFEDTKLMISSNYQEILTQLYGSDYMTPKRASVSETEVHNISRRNN